MNSQRRVTLRCLCDDLRSDWHDVHQQRRFAQLRRGIADGRPVSDIAILLDDLPTTTRAAHPLVASFAAAFAGDDPRVHRESISGLTEPRWWKQKVSRWRGAATDAAIVGEDEVWLCAGGLRAAGDHRDFYATFTESVSAHGAAQFLPAAEDRLVQEVETRVARRDAWVEQVKLSVVVVLDEVLRSSTPLAVPLPPPAPAPATDLLAHLELSVERAGEGTEEIVELTIVVSRQDRSKLALIGVAIDAVQSMISPVVQEWRVLPGIGTDEVWSTLLIPEIIEAVQTSAEFGELTVELAGQEPVQAVRAHFTRKDRIVDASIEGDAVAGLCGQWFVPTADPDGLPVCEVCARISEGFER